MAHLKADRARLAQIESEIDELEQKLQLLRTEKNTAQGRLDAFKYPVLTLPNEITSEIFVQVLPPYPRCPPVTGRSSPTALTHVCRKWRDIGLATPQLWRAISLRETSGDSEETRIEMEKITIWLDRSRACALSIRMEHWPDLFSGVYNHPEECYDALLPHRERWEHLQLNVHNRHLHLFDGLQPSLKSLSLKMEDYEQGRPAVSDLDFPRLEAVSISNFERPVDWLPWSQLKSLTLNEMHPHQYIPILQNSRHLVHLTLLCCHGHDPSVAELPFPRLQTLLIFRCNQTFTETFRMLITPVLRRLQLPDAVMGDDPIDTLSSFVSRSGMPIAYAVHHRGADQRYFQGGIPHRVSYHPENPVQERI
ncbi:hypothetical protein FB45DRAFT_834880 [Roridomyces roridus]|uniref:F-box domain-containing protein n=1 Tax=Roridomyces roridus TaxID=1738132 RepID=A0AAD7FMN1_9AGAR|nr:hypothetical protein FB45DRAFT_834880 [Roridomyces roridus]